MNIFDCESDYIAIKDCKDIMHWAYGGPQFVHVYNKTGRCHYYDICRWMLEIHFNQS